MPNDTLQGRHFVVIGLGKSGLGAASLLLNRGARVTAFDENEKATAPFTTDRFTLKKGPLPERFWEGAEAVVVSPGVPLSKPELVAAKTAGATLYGEIELAWRFRPEGAGPMLGITGTNGKSTTTALLGELMSRHVPNTFVGGNLGTALTRAYEDPAQPPYAMHVVELSSFQLEGIVDASFRGAAILNLTPDHLDRYDSQETYGAAKARIFLNQPAAGFAVVNADDQHVVRLGRGTKAPLYSFTTDAMRTNAGFSGQAIGGGSKFILTVGEKPVFHLRNRSLRGKHNLENAMAAALMAHLSGVPASTIQEGLDAFPGLPHRMEFVRELDGVEWLNDSKATNVDSSLVALEALPGRVWLIAGGKGKGAPYAPLVDAAKDRVLGVLTIGADAPAIADAFKAFTVEACGTLEAAVTKARQLAKAGDIVLLSPACASYDQFNHFEHRGDTFKTLVRSL
ncbi:MAG: UDP-N-acetylmuramoyl-L-alanine--D-glutamate ligase [Myxococcales bacterium]|nr:UDP-N-acetylmuramoyl-L-alanine--D-glutamate ligase [Myxococcales bacterium]